MTTKTINVSTSGTSRIRARDFAPRTTTPGRDDWTVGKLRHVIAALAGAPVILTVDDQTGHTVIGVTLEGTYGVGSDASVIVNYGTRTTRHYLFSLGDTIIPLTNPAGGSGHKWVALNMYRDEVSAAIRLAQARHGEVEGRAWGAWEGTCTAAGVHVTYTPSPELTEYAKGKAGTPWSGSFSPVAEARARRDAATD